VDKGTEDCQQQQQRKKNAPLVPAYSFPLFKIPQPVYVSNPEQAATGKCPTFFGSFPANVLGWFPPLNGWVANR
jgi:hypothetical protein